MAKKKSKPSPKSQEPEVLGPNTAVEKAPAKIDTARAALASAQKAKAKRDPFIDKAVNWLKGETDTTGGDVQVDVRILLRQAYQLDRVDASSILGFLKQAKADGRLQIIPVDDVTMITLGGDLKLSGSPEQEDPAAEPQAEVIPFPKKDAAEKAEKAEVKTIEQHFIDAQGRQTKLPFPHDVGTWVLLLKDTKPGRILNMHQSGTIILYDLKLEDGTTMKAIPAFEIEELSKSDAARIKAEEHNRALQGHADRGAKLAKRKFEIMAQEVADSEALKATRKRLKGIEEKIDQHMGMLPDNGQQELDLDVEEDDGVGEITAAGEAPIAPAAPTTAQERLIGRLAGKDTLELTGDNQPWDKLGDATLKAEDSTGKPPQVEPLTIKQAPGKWVCVDMQDGVAVLLPALTRDEYKAKYQERFDAPRELPSNEPSVKQLAGGPKTGSPIKVGRTTLFLGPLDDALLLRMPATAAAQA